MRGLIYLITLAVSTVIQTGCGPATLLQMAERRGAKITRDTVYQDVITERTITDTVTHFQEVSRIFTDTITTETVRWKSWLRIDTLTKTVYQQVECKPDTIRVAASVSTTIEAGYSVWDILKWCAFSVVLALIAFAAYRAILR